MPNDKVISLNTELTERSNSELAEAQALHYELENLVALLQHDRFPPGFPREALLDLFEWAEWELDNYFQGLDDDT